MEIGDGLLMLDTTGLSAGGTVPFLPLPAGHLKVMHLT